jgi:hypothetical protein
MVLCWGALSTVGCVSQSATDKLISEMGSSFVARGVLDAAGLLGRSCADRSLAGADKLADCGSGGSTTTPGDLTTLGAGAARAAIGVALWAIAGKPPDALSATKPGPTRTEDAALMRYTDQRHTARLTFKHVRCVRGLACARDLDPRRTLVLE